MNCTTKIVKADLDWQLVKNECRTTVNKDPTDTEPSEAFKIQLLISEHSPIRILRIHWKWDSIKSWVATHFARHWLGWDKWIGTRRSDRTGVDRGELTQDELVPMDVEANAQALINVSRYRLCYQAADETRGYMENLKSNVETVSPEIAFTMVPNCIYRGGCPEFHPCGFYQSFLARHPGLDLSNIRERYQAYHDDFHGGQHV